MADLRSRRGRFPKHRIDECVRCIRLDPDVSLAQLASRIGVQPNALRKHLAAAGVRRDADGAWQVDAKH